MPSTIQEPAPADAKRDIIVVGASAGGVESLERFVAGFPANLPAAIFVVLHVMPGGTSVLSQILQRRTRLVCAAARDGEAIERGRIYVAPPDHHLLVRDGHVELTRGARENGHRPAVDALFRSAARAYGRRVIGVVLSGALDDGTAGLGLVVECGGCGLVQDPEEALYPSMPGSALANVPGTEALPVSDMAARICEIMDQPVPGSVPTPGAPGMSRTAAGTGRPADTPDGAISDLTCPECGGTLWETEENGITRYRCHVGHVYSVDALEVSQSDALEGALWGALRNLEERARLFRRLSARFGDARVERYAARAEDAARHAATLRELMERLGEPGIAGEPSVHQVPTRGEASDG